MTSPLEPFAGLTGDETPESTSTTSEPSAPKTKKKVTRKKRPAAKKSRAKAVAAPIPRGTASFDDEDFLLSGSGSAGFGRCGGRVMGSQLEAQICSMLSAEGITHSHAPRHFEVRLSEKQVAAYAPMIVLRGRGREGKTVVIEAVEKDEELLFSKIRAFRAQYGLEFYVSFVAPEEVLDTAPLDLADESTATINLKTLISRLAD